MRIPLRLAITDQIDEEEEGGAEAEQPWSVRLAGRLLHKVAQGQACPWAPYLQVGAGSAARGCLASCAAGNRGGTPERHGSQPHCCRRCLAAGAA